MSTRLHFITNAKFTGKETKEDWDLMLEKLKSIDLLRTQNELNGKWIETEGEWEYFTNEDPDSSLVDFEGPYDFFPQLYTNVGVISIIYRYSFLYELKNGYLDSFRKSLYQIVKAIGGTEGIYLPDNSYDKLSYYLECLAWENIPYEEIKEKMLAELGKPITNYYDLDSDRMNDEIITEYFLDDFSDLK